MKFKNLRAPRPASWAWFSGQDYLGRPEKHYVSVRYWALDDTGNVVGLVGHKDGLEDARSFNNFVEYTHDEKPMRRELNHA